MVGLVVGATVQNIDQREYKWGGGLCFFLTTWIKNWKNTYGEKPSLEECVTWVEWNFEDSSVSESVKQSIQEVLSCNDF